jgi:hypothetical protein
MALEDKPRTNEDIDEVISAQLSNVVIHPKLYASVIKHMIHGSCGAQDPITPCMINGKCSKGYLKSFAIETIVDEDGHTKYKRYVFMFYTY